MFPLLFGLLGPLLGKVVDTVGTKLGVDMNTDEMKSKRLEVELELQKLIAQGDYKQMEINLAEAANPNRRWPTWRECLGYICAFAVLYHFVIQQFLAFTANALGHNIQLPDLEMSGLMSILSAMLGVHFIDSKFNSPAGQNPIDINRGVLPTASQGKMSVDENGDQVWTLNK